MDARSILKHNFGRPRVMTWGWPLMLLSFATALLFAVRCLLKGEDLPFPASSIAGCCFLSILGTLIALIFPAVYCARGIEDKPVGRYTGVGTLLLSLVSGVPLMMIRVPLYNLTAYLTLRFARSSVYPVFFHADPVSKYGIALSVVSEIIIPALGASLFFFGLLWSRFRSTDSKKACIIIAAAYALYSMDFTAVPALIATGVWCCYLRARVHNMWAPFLCLVSVKVTEMLLPESLSMIDIFTVQTHSDIESTYFYSSLPSFFMGMVLLLFFIRVLDSFSISVRHEVTGSEDDALIPAFDKSINLSLLLTIAVFIVVWILLFKGVYI